MMNALTVWDEPTLSARPRTLQGEQLSGSLPAPGAPCPVRIRRDLLHGPTISRAVDAGSPARAQGRRPPHRRESPHRLSRPPSQARTRTRAAAEEAVADAAARAEKRRRGTAVARAQEAGHTGRRRLRRRRVGDDGAAGVTARARPWRLAGASAVSWRSAGVGARAAHGRLVPRPDASSRPRRARRLRPVRRSQPGAAGADRGRTARRRGGRPGAGAQAADRRHPPGPALPLPPAAKRRREGRRAGVEQVRGAAKRRAKKRRAAEGSRRRSRRLVTVRSRSMRTCWRSAVGANGTAARSGAT
jgi:hypothetical protein